MSATVILGHKCMTYCPKIAVNNDILVKVFETFKLSISKRILRRNKYLPPATPLNKFRWSTSDDSLRWVDKSSLSNQSVTWTKHQFGQTQMGSHVRNKRLRWCMPCHVLWRHLDEKAAPKWPLCVWKAGMQELVSLIWKGIRKHIHLELPEYPPVLSADEERPEYILKKLKHNLPTTQAYRQRLIECP